MAAGKCPKCDRSLVAVNTSYVEVKGRRQTSHGISYLCSACNAILSVSIDPVALKMEIVNEILQQLKKE